MFVMEVAGKRNKCQPCYFEEKTIPADKYCIECREYICNDCVSVHGKFKATRHHRVVLQNESNAPMQVWETNDDDQVEINDNCEVHPEEVIKFHCVTHGTLHCGNCLVRGHRSCEIIIINEVASSFETGFEQTDIYKSLEALSNDAERCISMSNENIKISSNYEEKAQTDIDQYFNKVVAYFAKKKAEMKKEVSSLSKTKCCNMVMLKCRAQEMKSQALSLKGKCTRVRTNPQIMYIEAIRAQQQLPNLRSDYTEVLELNQIQPLSFVRCPQTERILSLEEGFGTLSIEQGI